MVAPLQWTTIEVKNREINRNKGRDRSLEERMENKRSQREGEITDVLVLVLAIIPPNVPSIKGGVHPFCLTLTIAL